MSLSMSSPLVIADVLGATVFMLCALFFLFKGSSTDTEKAQVFTALFAAIAVAVAIVVK